MVLLYVQTEALLAAIAKLEKLEVEYLTLTLLHSKPPYRRWRKIPMALLLDMLELDRYYPQPSIIQFSRPPL